MPAAQLANDERPPSADRMPTLTEVVELGPAQAGAEAGAFEVGAPAAGDGQAQAQPGPLGPPRLGTGADPGPVASAGDPLAVAPDPAPSIGDAALAPPASVGVEVLVSRVLAELQPRVDLLFELRLREALAPALARAADGLIRDTRDELAAAVYEMVREAAARVIEQRDQR